MTREAIAREEGLGEAEEGKGGIDCGGRSHIDF